MGCFDNKAKWQHSIHVDMFVGPTIFCPLVVLGPAGMPILYLSWLSMFPSPVPVPPICWTITSAQVNPSKAIQATHH